MPRSARLKRVGCEKNLDRSHLRNVRNGLLRIFFAIRLSKRIKSDDSVCQRCRTQFLHWQRKMEGDFDKFAFKDQTQSNDIDDDDECVCYTAWNYGCLI
jgi:hypothetical protein